MGLGQTQEVFGLRGLDPGHQVWQEQAVRAIETRRVAFGVEPAVSGQVLADFRFEVDFLVQAHVVSSLIWRTPSLLVFRRQILLQPHAASLRHERRFGQ